MMPKKASKKQLLDWEKRLSVQMFKVEAVQSINAEVNEELEVIMAEMREYGMLEDTDEISL